MSSVACSFPEIVTKSRAYAHELARFVPAGVLEATVRDPQALRAPTHDRFDAAIMFADISGFTRLSEHLAEKGATGVEDLTRILNSFFGRLIDIIHAHGGDVAKFAGDALHAVWKVDEQTTLQDRTRVAAQCALTARDELLGFALEGGGTLSLRIGVGAGAVDFVTLGGVLGRWEFGICGPPVMEAAASAAHSEPGAVVSGPAAWALLSPHCRGAERGAEGAILQAVNSPLPLTPLVRVDPPEDVASRLLAYIPAAIHQRLAAQQSAWLGELRWLTVLFVNLPDLHSKTPLHTMQLAMRSLQEGIYRFEGSVNKLSIDEKGVTLVAALGLPPLSHEDDPTRGVRTAMEVRSRLDALGWRGSIGVTSGRVFCGTIGNAQRCEYTIIGAVVNLAARLMQAADGGILCDSTTQTGTGEKLAYQPLIPIRVKGKTNLVPVFRPMGQGRDAVNPHNVRPMVGRVEEQRLLQSWMEALSAERRGGSVIIGGEAGIGKSRFVALIRERAATLHLRLLHGAADAIERTTPYYAWRSVFRDLLGIRSNEEAVPRLEHLLKNDPQLARLSPLLGVVLGVSLPDNEVTTHIAGASRITSTNDLLVGLLSRAAQSRPHLLIVEDCHWLDSASWSLVGRVAHEVGSLLLVLVTRPLAEPFPREYLQLTTNPDTRKVTLIPLGAEESLQLACQRLGVDALPEAAAELIRTRAQGNPFFSEELAFALRDSGMLKIEQRTCRLADDCDLANLSFPETVQGVVTSRIDRLEPAAQLTLKVASVIGRVFSCRLLKDVFPLDGGALNSGVQLEELVRHNLTLLDSPPPNHAHIFRHVITQEVAYNLMPPTQRSQLHRSVALWYEDKEKDQLATFYPLLAKHWSNAGDVAKAIDYLEKSADDALRHFANQEACKFLQQAIDLDRRTPGYADDFRRACWHRQLGEALYGLGEIPQSLESFREALRLLHQPLPTGAVRSLAGCLSEFARQLAHRILPARSFRQEGPAARITLEAARAYERVAQICYLNNAKTETIHAALKSLNLAERVGPCRELARGYAHAGVVFGLLMMHGTARANAARARETAEFVNEPPCTAYVEFVRALYWITVGRWEDAESNTKTAIRIAGETGEHRRYFESAFTLAVVYLRRGEPQRSAEVSAEMTAAARRYRLPQETLWGLSWQLATELVASARPDFERELRTEITAWLPAHAAEIPLADHILGFGLTAWAHWRAGDHEAALAAAAAAESVITRTSQIANYLLPAFSALAHFYFARASGAAPGSAELKEMTDRLVKTCRTLRDFRLMYPVAEPTACLHIGRLHWLKGRAARATREWQRGIEAASKLVMPHDEALLHREAALRSPPGKVASGHATRARELFAQVGAKVPAPE